MTFVTGFLVSFLYLCPVKFIRNITFALATLILVLHVLVPHEHHFSEGDTIGSGHSPESILGHIALGFHLSQADGQLEHFPAEVATPETGQQQLIAVISVALFGIRTADFQQPQRVYFAPNTAFKSLNVNGFSHRGPPIA